ncbi:unnamed protein product [Periconia digitata]|uniref:Uncharacterized protein n=1 Tax=Periconia digitata TaxID=1303443 RepID=A0A9W4UP53_9PLEO|nr:unnamed protein product [Periconia digitata]
MVSKAGKWNQPADNTNILIRCIPLFLRFSIHLDARHLSFGWALLITHGRTYTSTIYSAQGLTNGQKTWIGLHSSRPRAVLPPWSLGRASTMGQVSNDIFRPVCIVHDRCQMRPTDNTSRRVLSSSYYYWHPISFCYMIDHDDLETVGHVL